VQQNGTGDREIGTATAFLVGGWVKGMATCAKRRAGGNEPDWMGWDGGGSERENMYTNGELEDDNEYTGVIQREREREREREDREKRKLLGSGNSSLLRLDPHDRRIDRGGDPTRRGRLSHVPARTGLSSGKNRTNNRCRTSKRGGRRGEREGTIQKTRYTAK